MHVWRLIPSWLRLALAVMLVVSMAQVITVFGWLLPQNEDLTEGIAVSRKPVDGNLNQKRVVWQRYQDINNDMAEFYRRIPVKTKLPEFMAELEQMTKRSGLDVNSIRFRPGVVKGSQPELLQYELHFAVSGTYEKLYKFIRAVEQSSRILSLKKVTFSQRGKGPDVMLSMALETFFLQGGDG